MIQCLNFNVLLLKCSTANLQEKELRSAPAKPKSLVPPTAKLGTNSHKLKKQQSSADRTPTPTQQAHIKKVKSQNSDEEKEKRKETQIQRQILFDELEEIEERLEIFKADSKAESISVQGAKKFEKIVNLNKQLRQFKKVHDRNKIICQESLGENSEEEQNFIPELPQQKELSRRYIKFDKPSIAKRKDEKTVLDFQAKHKKLTEAYNQTRSRNVMSDTTIQNLSQPRAEKAEEKMIETKNFTECEAEMKTTKQQSSVRQLEDALFKDIETLNITKNDISNIRGEEDIEETEKLNNINLLSTTIDETFEGILDNLPPKEIKPGTHPAKGRNIKQLIMKFEVPSSDSHQKSDSDSEKVLASEATQHQNGKDSFLSSKFLDVFSKTTPIFSSIDESWSPTNSMNQEVINFQEELLNFEADSLNPPDENTKRMSLSNTKAMRRLSFDEMEADNFERERNKQKERKDKRNTESNLIQSYNVLSGDREGDKYCESHQSDTAPGGKDIKQASPVQNGFLSSSRPQPGASEEKKTSPKLSFTSEFKNRFLSSFSFENSPPETLESSIFGSSGKSYQEREKAPRKKSVHFESDEQKNMKEIVISPVGSYFPIIGSILSAGPSKLEVPDISPEKKVPNIILNVPIENVQGGSRKESLESIETVDTVDLELIKLGLHKSSGVGGPQEIRGEQQAWCLVPAVSPLCPVTCGVSASSSQSPASSETVTATASSEYINLLRNEEKITQQNARLASKSMAQKSNFEVSKSLNVLSATQSEHEGERAAPLPVPGQRARPPLRPMLMMGYMGPGRGGRGLSPRISFPPPHLRPSPPGRPAGPGDMARVSSPQHRVRFFR